jgi:hypothetical protein
MPTVTAQARTDQRDPLSTLPTTPTTPLRMPRQKATGLLRFLHTVMRICIRSHAQEHPRINPAYSRQETVVDRVVWIDPYLYTCSLSG